MTKAFELEGGRDSRESGSDDGYAALSHDRNMTLSLVRFRREAR